MCSCMLTRSRLRIRSRRRLRMVRPVLPARLRLHQKKLRLHQDQAQRWTQGRNRIWMNLLRISPRCLGRRLWNPKPWYPAWLQKNSFWTLTWFSLGLHWKSSNSLNVAVLNWQTMSVFLGKTSAPCTNRPSHGHALWWWEISFRTGIASGSTLWDNASSTQWLPYVSLMFFPKILLRPGSLGGQLQSKNT